MYDNLKNYATKALIVSALLGGNSVMMPAFAAGEHGMAAPASDGRVKGTVTDAKGEPLTGVVVRVVGADVSYAAVTDIDGKFNIKVPNKKSMLEIRGVGYKTKRVSAQDDLNIKMEEDISNLNEVVVIGYGTLDKKEVTSAITSIKGKDLMVGVGGADVSSALQGKISGLVIFSDSTTKRVLRSFGACRARTQSLRQTACIGQTWCHTTIATTWVVLKPQAPTTLLV